MLETAVPVKALDAVDHAKPSPAVGALMDLLVERVLSPARTDRGGVPISAWLLYLRSHWLRMPPWLLTRHLTHKALRRVSGRSSEGA
jgi:hypothetical protein